MSVWGHKRSTGWVWRRFDGDVLLCGPDREVRRIAGAAAISWLALDEPATATEILDRTVDRWADAAGRPAVLITDALAELAALGAVERVI